MEHYIKTLLLFTAYLLVVSSCAASGVILTTTQSVQALCHGQVAIYHLELSDGFHQNYTLSAEGLPTQASVTFAPENILPGNSATLRVETASLAAGVYPFRVRAQAGADWII
ncbi:MAG: hypothetical protein D6772_16280, partial [Bacteroidetes bacterium]